MTLTDEQLTDLVVAQISERMSYVAREAVYELRAYRNAALTAEDRKALSFARDHLYRLDFECAEADLQDRAIDIIDRLLATKGS